MNVHTSGEHTMTNSHPEKISERIDTSASQAEKTPYGISQEKRLSYAEIAAELEKGVELPNSISRIPRRTAIASELLALMCITLFLFIASDWKLSEYYLYSLAVLACLHAGAFCLLFFQGKSRYLKKIAGVASIIALLLLAYSDFRPLLAGSNSKVANVLFYAYIVSSIAVCGLIELFPKTYTLK